MSQPLITIARSLDAEGILLLPVTHPDVASVAPHPQSEDEEALLRYAVVLKNATPHGIIAYYVRWKFTDASDKAVTGVIHDKSFPSGRPIPPHGAKFLSLHSGIGVDSGRTRAMNERVRDLWDRRPRFYPAQRSIEVSSELAVFDDGTAVGPDDEGMLSTFEAWMDAERDFARRALAENSVVGFRRRVQDALDQGFDALPKEQRGNLGSLPAAADSAPDYSECYQFATAWLASDVMRWIDQSGEEAAREGLRRLTSKRYPELHRKGE